MIACQRCQSTYEDEQLRYCGRCGSDMRPSVSKDGLATAAAPEEDSGIVSPLIGKVVDGRYRVLSLIGTGGMGSVFKVEHTGMGKIAALKMLHPTLSTDREIVKRFRREAEAVSMLASPNTVQVFDFGESEGCLYMVMELCRGEDLAQILRRDGPMPWTRAAPLLAQICEALTEAHEAGIVHRDLKPENVIVTRGSGGRNVAKVLDFGLAKLREREELGAVTARGSLIGTPFYMSPEQIRSEEPDARSDIYSFGAMTYRMLTGTHPFTGPTPVAVLTQHLTDELEPPSKRCPDRKEAMGGARVEALVMRCMAKRREERFQTIDEVRKAIEEARGPDTSPLPREAPSGVLERRAEISQAAPVTRLSREDFDRFERNLKIRRWLALATVPVLLLAAGAVGWFLYHREEVPQAVENEVEPNDTAQQANLIASGKTVHGGIGKRLNVEESDRDFYHFHVDHGPMLGRIELSPIPNMDLRVAIFDAQGGKVAESDAGREGDPELIPNQRLDAGEYYVEVREVWVSGRQATENITDQYGLTVSYRPIGSDEEVEPDDAPQSALAVPVGRPITGYLHRAGDLDYFRPTGTPGILDGEVAGVEGIDLKIVVLPAGVEPGADPATAPGAKVFDTGGPGKGERFAGLSWAAGSAPFVVVTRKDRGPDASGKTPRVSGASLPYTLTLSPGNPSVPLQR
jgi:serine/threonine-protein kinase